MKTKLPISLFFILAAIFAHAQGKFDVKEGKIIWSKHYSKQITPDNIAINLKAAIAHSIEPFVKERNIYGTTTLQQNIKEDSDLGAIFRQPFGFSYKIMTNSSGYYVQVRDFIFKNIEIEIYGVKDTADQPIEEYLIRSRDGEIRKNKMSHRVQERLAAHLNTIFNPETLTTDGW